MLGRSTEVFHQGSFRTALWVPDESGTFRGKEYYSNLRGSDRAKLYGLVERHCGTEHGYRNNQEKYRHEGDGIWVFKSYQDRLFCFTDERLVLMTHGFRKKSNRMPAQQIALAKRIREHHLSGSTS